jgi:hypothetical protein
VNEVVNARIYGGIHYRSADEDGVKIGKQVARFATRHFFRRAKP